MPTIGRRRPRSSPRGDFESMCAICGTAYLRSQLTKRSDGQLYCRDKGCSGGMTRVEIAEAIKAASMRRKYPVGVRDGGNWDHQADPPPNGNRPLPHNGPSAGTPGDGIKDTT